MVLVRDALNNQALYQAASISTTARGASDVFVDDVFTITTDFGAGGLSVGDVVTFANGEVEAIAGLVFGTNAFSSIEAAAAAVGAGPGRIYLGTGTFTLAAQLSMSGDVKIIGAGQEKSKIMYGFDTAQAGNARGGIFGDAASAMEFCNLTIDGTGHSVHTGIRAAGTVGLYGVKMIDISYPPYHGISLASVGADATVENSVFVRSNRAGIYFYGTGTKLARWNDVTGKGDGDWVNSGIETGGGATVLVEENALRSLTGVASLDGSESIALYAYSYSGASFNYTARRNTIDNATYGFYISLIGGEFVAVAQENRLANVEFGMANDLTSVVDATRNWWGAATGPTYSGNANGTGAKLSEAYADNITYVPWLTE